MAKISLACAVGGALLEPQQNTNNETELGSVYSSAQHCTALSLHRVRHVSVPHPLMPLISKQYAFRRHIPNHIFCAFIVSTVSANFSPFSSFYL